MDKARNSESHSEKLPEIQKNFHDIRDRFNKYFVFILTNI